MDTRRPHHLQDQSTGPDRRPTRGDPPPPPASRPSHTSTPPARPHPRNRTLQLTGPRERHRVNCELRHQENAASPHGPSPAGGRRMMRQSRSIATRTHPNTVSAETRHSHATALLLSGAPVHVVSRRLGHTDVQTTLNVYAHVTEDAEMRTVAQWRAFTAGWPDATREATLVGSCS